MKTEILEPEIVTSTDGRLIKYASQQGLEKPATETLVEAFRPIFAKARIALASANGVAESVKDATCVKEIRASRACRLAIRAVRLEGDDVHKQQKKAALLFGRAVDGFRNILLADLSPVETALQEAEDIAERAEAARKAELKLTREAEVNAFLETPYLGADLSDLSEADYARALSDTRLLRQAKIDAAEKVEADRLAREEQYRKEAEENARLKVEAEKQAAAAKAEREAAEKKLADERAAAEAARKAAEDKAFKELQAIEAKAKAERETAAKAARIAAEQAQREREAIEAKAKAERAAADAEARKEQSRLQAIALEEQKKLVAAELAAKVLRDAEAKRLGEVAVAARNEAQARAAAEKKAAAAPDKAKLQAFADTLREMPMPTLKTTLLTPLIAVKIEELALWIEARIERL
jgi:hypothetical protein